MSWTNDEMAKEVLKLIQPKSSVNLGIGLPTLIADFITDQMDLMIHSENGVLGVGPSPQVNEVSPTLINAGKETITIKSGASFFDSSLSFGMIRGGHIDYSVLGGMQVDCDGSLANWMIPGKKITGMGGAMDLVHGSKTVIIMMSHFSKDGSPKILPVCDLPLTGFGVVHLVVTDHGVFKFEKDHYKIEKLAPHITEAMVISKAIRP